MIFKESMLMFQHQLSIKLFLLLLTFISSISHAELVSDQESIIVYRVEDAFEDVRDNVRIAIENQGLRINSVLPIANMLKRTGADLGFKKNVYIDAEALEFCSAVLSHRIVQENPANASICPFAILVYVRQDQPKQVYVSFRRPLLLNTDNGLQEELAEFIQDIIEEALG